MFTLFADNQWPVDFNLPLSSFTPHIRGTGHLINLCQKSKHWITLLFTSSIDVVTNWSSSKLVPELAIEDLTVAGMGYGKSKLVAELLLHTAGERKILDAQVCRVGQIAGPTSEKGSWNRKEWLPTLIDASAHLKLLPRNLQTLNDVDWIPVDILSHILCELVLSVNPLQNSTCVYHTVNPKTTPWESITPIIQSRLEKTTKSKIELISFVEWMAALRHAVDNPSGADIIPGSKLLEFYQGISEEGEKGRGSVRLDTTKTQTMSKKLTEMEAVSSGWMNIWLSQWGY
jgi:thioester reductase-like protein